MIRSSCSATSTSSASVLRSFLIQLQRRKELESGGDLEIEALEQCTRVSATWPDSGAPSSGRINTAPVLFVCHCAALIGSSSSCAFKTNPFSVRPNRATCTSRKDTAFRQAFKRVKRDRRDERVQTIQ